MSALPPKADITPRETEVASRSSRVIDNLLGGVIDHNRRVKILKFGVSAKHRFYSVLESRSVRLLGGFNVLPQIHAATAPRGLVKDEGLMDQIRISLPCRDR